MLSAQPGRSAREARERPAEEAVQHDPAAGWASAAAAAATAALAFEDAARYLTTALAAADSAGAARDSGTAAERAVLLIELATAEYRAGQLANLDAVDVEIGQIAQLAEATRLPLIRWHLLRQQASRAALAGRFAEAKRQSWAAYRLAVRLQDPSAAGLSYSFAVLLAALRGKPSDVPADFPEDTAGFAAPPIVRAGQALALYVLGRPDEARAVYETVRSLPGRGDQDSRNLGALSHILDLIIAFCDEGTALAAYDLMASHAADTGVTGTGVVFLSGSPHWPLGRLAALLGRTEAALEHFATAVTVNTRLGGRPFVVLARLDWAGALRARGWRGDQAEALLLARQAAEEAHRLDMPGPARRAEQLMSELRRAIQAGNPLTPRER